MRHLAISMVVLVASLAAQDSRPVKATENLAPSIANLDHESYEVRSSAMLHLRSVGESARTYLEKASKDLASSLEARGRAEALLKELDAKKSGSPLNPVEPMAPERIDDITTSPQDGATSSSSTSMISGPDGTVEIRKDKEGIRLTVKPRDGTVSVYQAKDLETFKKEHPEFYEKYRHMGLDGSTIRFNSGINIPRIQGGLWRGELGEIKIPEIKIPDMPNLDHPDIQRLLRDRVQGNGIRLFPWAEPQDRVEAPSGRQLGVVVEKASPLLDRHLKLGGVGVVVVQVVPNSLAQKLGLEVDDIIKSVNGAIIKDVEGIRKALNPTAPEKPSESNPALEVIRNGDVIKL